MHFWKMQGTGNDFVVLDCVQNMPPENIPELARTLCDRHFGIGGDGLILVQSSDCADGRMRIFNANGSEPEMCGNGIRCVGKFLYDMGYVRKNVMTVETLGGIKTLTMTVKGDHAVAATVDMGMPILEPAQIPVQASENRVKIAVEGREIEFFCVSMGNPHAVTYDYFPEYADFLRIGAILERHPMFPRRANIEFCRAADPEHVEVRVWERGCGATLACGTGASACLVAGHAMGILHKEADLRLPGGVLHLALNERNHVEMTGAATTVFCGDI